MAALSYNEWLGFLRRTIQSSVYPDFAVRWNSPSVGLPEKLGFFCSADLGVDSLTFLQRSSVSGFDIEGTSHLLSLSFPVLDTCAGKFVVKNNTGLVSIDAPRLTSVTGLIDVATGNTALTSISMPRLTTNSLNFGTITTSITPKLTNVGTLDLTSFGSLVTATLTAVTNVTKLLDAHGLTSLATVSAANLATAGKLNFNGCTALATLTLTGLTHTTGLIDLTGCTTATTFTIANLLHADAGITVAGATAMTTLTLTNLLDCGPLTITGNTATGFTTISLPALTAVYGKLDVHGNTHATALNAANLVTATGGIDAHGCTALAATNLSAFKPTNGSTLNFNACALSAGEVNEILARAIANPLYVSGTINTAGGTNAAPTGQGATDKTALIARGVTVTTA